MSKRKEGTMEYRVAIAENEEVNTAICFAAALGDGEKAALIAAGNGCEIMTFDSLSDAETFSEANENATGVFTDWGTERTTGKEEARG